MLLAMKLNKRGDLRGINGTGKGPSGLGWDIFLNDEYVCSYKTLREAAQHVGHSTHYVWQMANGKTGNPKYYKYDAHKDNNGYSVKKKM